MPGVVNARIESGTVKLNMAKEQFTFALSALFLERIKLTRVIKSNNIGLRIQFLI